jgi:penicillin amidase
MASGGKRPPLGSNNWIAGTRTADGRALIANDMHLRLRVPNTWYRARLIVSRERLDVSGVTLPGVPAVVAGSNGHVAWGFTNSYGDFQDLVALESVPGAPDKYLTADGPRAFELDEETLQVAGAPAERLVVKRTQWGPVIGRDGSGRELALAWTAHRDGATDMAVLQLEGARDLDAAAAIMGGAGMPAQNVMLADEHGRIGRVLSGRLPQPRNRSVAPVALAPERFRLGRLVSPVGIAARARSAAGLRLDGECAGRGRRRLCAHRRRQLRTRGPGAPDPRAPRSSRPGQVGRPPRDPAG